jgi:hypothetical protein
VSIEPDSRHAGGRLIPNGDVRDELVAFLNQDGSRLGDVYRLTERGLDPQQIAAELGVGTSAFVGNYRVLVAALLNGDVPTAPSLVVEAAGKARTVRSTPGLSEEARTYLADLEQLLETEAAANERALTDLAVDDQATFGRPTAPAVEAAGRELRRALRDGDSVFTPGMPIWTLSNARELLDKYNGRPDASGSSFVDKLGQQLRDAPRGAVQLFAELFTLDVLPLENYKSATKRSLVTSVLALGGVTSPLPAVIDEAFAGGVLNGGLAFTSGRYRQMCYLVEFAVGFLAMDVADRARLLDDPRAFRDALDGVTSTNSPSQRLALLYLFFPKFFLPITSPEHRGQIRTTFLGKLASPNADPDEDVRDIHLALSAEAGHPIDLYNSQYRDQWDPKALSRTTDRRDPWTAFVFWSRRLDADIDLDAQEREYKLEMARRLDAARPALLSNESGWQAEFRAAVGYGNLLDRFFKTDLFKALDERPDQVRAVIERFWVGVPDPTRIAALAVDLRSLMKITPGNAVALGSVLLMTRDSSLYPPYRPTPVEKALALTATPASGTDPVERYDDLLALCDQVLERAPDAGLDLQDRLDAQGLIWAVATYDPPAEWTDADKKAFRHWRGDPETEESPARRAWLVRGSSVNGRDLVPSWLREDVVTLAATHLGNVEPGSTKDDLKPVIESNYSFASYAAREEKLDEFHNFLTVMQPGDLVVTTDQGRLQIGDLTGEVRHASSGEDGPRLERAMRWSGHGGVRIDDVPGELQARLAVQRDVLDLTLQASVIEELLAAEAESVAVPAPTALVLPDATEDLATELFVGRDWLQKCVDLLNDRPQLIFYGPPGTGKTFIAQRLAKHVAGDNVRLVQFHPAYSYEDFFEGFRPLESGGFKLKPGPMRRIVDQAVANPSVPHVLIIDEINRGNLAKVFGELYFLLEYRDQNVELLYSDGDFSLPRNVFIIGTMNTADRSIALVDAAMRRRFAFLPLHPSEPPTKGILRAWLAANDRPGRNADLLDELNLQIDDPDFKIGPSYLMRDAVYEDGGLELAWETAILPLLEEHHYGELDRADVIARYGVDVIGRRVERRDVSEPAEVSQDLGDAPAPHTA